MMIVVYTLYNASTALDIYYKRRVTAGEIYVTELADQPSPGGASACVWMVPGTESPDEARQA